MKRKDYEDKYDDFSSIYLSSPSTKSRRLDPDFVQFANEDLRSTVPQMVEPLPREPHLPSSNMAPIDVVAPTPAADGGYENEKALVLYNPINTPLFKSPTSPDFSLVVNSDLIPGLKDRFWLGKSNMVKPFAEAKTKEQTTYVSDNRLALIPWFASQGEAQTQAVGMPEPMEAEEVEMMDADDNSDGRTGAQLDTVVEGAGGLQQWQQLQQHCIKPELFQKTHTPVTW